MSSDISVPFLSTSSAHWCPPCRSFTPVLSEFYEQLKEEDENSLEIIFASSDSDAESFKNYYGEMPWNAIPFEHPSIKEDLSTRFEIKGLPTLVILNMADGSMKDAEGRGTVTSAKGNTQKVLKKWA
jgi:nucleoredoxin